MGGFRLGVGVKSLVGSASAWSVKGGFLLLPATRERKKKSSLFSGTGEQKRLLSTTLFFYRRYLLLLSWIPASTSSPCFCLFPHHPFLRFLLRSRGGCACACVLRHSLAIVLVGSNHFMTESFGGHGWYLCHSTEQGSQSVGGGFVPPCLKAFAGLDLGMLGAIRPERCCHRLRRQTYHLPERHLPAKRRGETGRMYGEGRWLGVGSWPTCCGIDARAAAVVVFSLGVSLFNY